MRRGAHRQERSSCVKWLYRVFAHSSLALALDGGAKIYNQVDTAIALFGANLSTVCDTVQHDTIPETARGVCLILSGFALAGLTVFRHLVDSPKKQLQIIEDEKAKLQQDYPHLSLGA